MLRHQFNRILRGAPTYPKIGTAPILPAAIPTGATVTYTAAASVTGSPTPVVTYDLYKNGALFTANYVSGAYTTTTTGDRVFVRATATNSVAAVSSDTATVVIGYPVFSAQSAPAGSIGVAYSYTFVAASSPTYALASGSLPPGLTLSSGGVLSGTPTTVGSYTFTVAATNAAGTVNSTSQTLAVSYLAQIIGAPVVGEPIAYSIVGYAGSITSQQWYKNSGSGPVAIGGATGSTYTPVSGDVGAYLSVRAVVTGGMAASAEFTVTNTVIQLGTMKTAAGPSNGLSFVGSQGAGITTTGIVTVRSVSGTSYIDTLVGPGTYSGSTLGDMSAVQPNPFFVNIYVSAVSSTTSVIAPVTKTASTATRPAASTGTGNFVKNGAIYDANGNKVVVRGINQCHYDSGSAGKWNSGANVQRLFVYTTQDWTTVNKPLLDAMVTTAHHALPMPTIPTCMFSGTVSISGNTMTVSAATSGNLYVGFVIPTASGITGCTITAVGSPDANGLGKTGTYTISNSQTVSSVAVTWTTAANQTTGASSPLLLLAAAQTWCDQVAQWGTFDKWSFLNVANEWGPTASAGNTVWRDTCITAIGMLRTAGYLGTIVFDAPGSGQDTYSMINHAAAVFNADPQKNTVFSLHVYGGQGKFPGKLAPTLASMQASASSNGHAYLIGEFGPGRLIGPSPALMDPREVMAVAEAYDMGWIAWAWDDNDLANGMSDDNWFAMVFNSGGGYAGSNVADLTTFGAQVVLDPVHGTALATAATSF